jgi:hypothetical protein
MKMVALIVTQSVPAAHPSQDYTSPVQTSLASEDSARGYPWHKDGGPSAYCSDPICAISRLRLSLSQTSMTTSLGPSVTHRESLCPVASKFFFFSCEFHPMIPIIYQCGNEANLQHAKNSANTLIGSACCSEKSRLRRPRFPHHHHHHLFSSDSESE